MAHVGCIIEDDEEQMRRPTSPHTFDTLETMTTTPFERKVVVLTRNYITRINPGDYAFMIGNGASAVWYD